MARVGRQCGKRAGGQVVRQVGRQEGAVQAYAKARVRVGRQAVRQVGSERASELSLNGSSSHHLFRDWRPFLLASDCAFVGRV